MTATTYGNVLSETAGGARSAIKFTGRYFDTETGLQWNLNRWYDAKTGRWLSQDPIGFEGGDGNLYRYVGNDPGNGVDPSGLDYRDDFYKATPAMPSGWRVHHTYQQQGILAERFQKELGINVHDVQYLRGVHPDIHSEIGALQMKFCAQRVQKYGSWADAFRKTPLQEILDFNTHIEGTYCDLWVKGGAGIEEISRIEGMIADPRFLSIGKSLRINSTLKKAGIALGALGLFGLLAENTALAANIVAPPPNVQRALDEFLQQYRKSYEQALTSGCVSTSRWGHLHDAASKYLDEAGYPDSVKAVIHKFFLEKEAGL
ncbi:MAG: hypothetical protein LC130_05505 [Bryobacterales bacterium]|nr:hypothetical protein [Bryobacterales bacterium]